MRGDESAGLGELRSLAADADSTVADLPLIATLVRKKDIKGAMAAIDALEKKQPDKPVASNLRARLLLQQGDQTGAEKSFGRALEIQPTSSRPRRRWRSWRCWTSASTTRRPSSTPC